MAPRFIFILGGEMMDMLTADGKRGGNGGWFKEGGMGMGMRG